MAGPEAVVERMIRAQNAHDLEAMLECFDENYLSEQPTHPARTFRGKDQVRQNWSTLLETIPDFRSELLRTASNGDEIWAEIHWRGTKADGTRLDELGVVILSVRDGRIASGRLYVEEVEAESGDIDAAIRQMAGTD